METDNLDGQQIDQYCIVWGGMADVYLAEDTDLKRTVALKALSDVLAIDSQAVYCHAVYRRRLLAETTAWVGRAGQAADHRTSVERLFEKQSLKNSFL